MTRQLLVVFDEIDFLSVENLVFAFEELGFPSEEGSIGIEFIELFFVAVDFVFQVFQIHFHLLLYFDVVADG